MALLESTSGHSWHPSKKIFLLHMILINVHVSISLISQLPEFVGSDYFCESGCSSEWKSGQIYASDPLWDGKQCGILEKECCENSSLPLFHKILPSPMNESIELRTCCDKPSSDEDVLIECFEIFIE